MYERLKQNTMKDYNPLTDVFLKLSIEELKGFHHSMNIILLNKELIIDDEFEESNENTIETIKKLRMLTCSCLSLKFELMQKND